MALLSQSVLLRHAEAEPDDKPVDFRGLETAVPEQLPVAAMELLP